MREHRAHVARLHVGDEHDELALHLLGAQVLDQPAHHLPRRTLAQVDLLDVERVRARVLGDAQDAPHAQLELARLVVRVRVRVRVRVQVRVRVRVRVRVT